jgi:hypothetical protein
VPERFEPAVAILAKVIAADPARHGIAGQASPRLKFSSRRPSLSP